MLAIEVEFLMGRAVATEWNDRMTAEWPPHPQRLYSALVATHADMGADPRTEAALKWLESLPPPEICADESPSLRSVVSHFVPVNDDVAKVEKGKPDFRHVVDRRNRQERFFPAVVPNDPTVVFQWADANGLEDHREALRSVVENLSYLGHSSSPVRACLRTERVDATFAPTRSASDLALRVAGPGRFDRLSSIYRLRQKDESVQPPLGRVQDYALRTAAPASVFAPGALVLAFDRGPRLALDSTLPLMQHLRSALLARLGTTIDEILSGHDPSGKPTLQPHLAFLPLANIGHSHADGIIKGAALLLPRMADESAELQLRRALSTPWSLQIGPLGSISVRLVQDRADELKSLRFSRYARASECWASVTPVVLERFPKKKGPTPEELIAESCRRIELPTPAEIRMGSVAAVAGVPRVQEFHGKAKQVQDRVRRHVWLRFEQRVRGPLVIGAGRFLGLGLCLPWRGGGEA